MGEDRKMWGRREFLKGAALAGGAVASSPLLPFLLESTSAAALPEVDLPITGLPSLNETVSFMIRAGKFDEKNGIKINFKPRRLGPCLNDYRGGLTSVMACSAIVHEGDHLNRGLPTMLLFGTIQHYGTILTADPNIKTLKDLEGKKLGAATVSGNYAYFRWFAMKEGFKLRKENVQSVGVPALVATLLAGRVDALQCWEPAASIVEHKVPGKYHRIEYAHKWKEYTGFDVFPYLGVAAKKDWVDAHRGIIPKMYNTYKEAADFLYKNPDEGVRIMAKEVKGKIPTPALMKIVKTDTLGFHPHRFQDVKKETEALFQAMVDIGRLEKMPGAEIIYQWG